MLIGSVEFLQPLSGSCSITVVTVGELARLLLSLLLVLLLLSPMLVTTSPICHGPVTRGSMVSVLILPPGSDVVDPVQQETLKVHPLLHGQLSSLKWRQRRSEKRRLACSSYQKGQFAHSFSRIRIGPWVRYSFNLHVAIL